MLLLLLLLLILTGTSSIIFFFFLITSAKELMSVSLSDWLFPKWLEKIWRNFPRNVDNGPQNIHSIFDDVPDSSGTLTFDHLKIKGQRALIIEQCIPVFPLPVICEVWVLYLTVIFSFELFLITIIMWVLLYWNFPTASSFVSFILQIPTCHIAICWKVFAAFVLFSYCEERKSCSGCDVFVHWD